MNVSRYGTRADVARVSRSLPKVPWGPDRINQRTPPPDSKDYQDGYDGTGVNVCVIDSGGCRLSNAGVVGIRTSHSDFGVALDWRSTPLRRRKRARLQRSRRSCRRHRGGEGFWQSVDPQLGASIWLRRQGPSSHAVAGVDWVAASHKTPAVACMSLGTSGGSEVVDSAESRGSTTTFHAALMRLRFLHKRSDVRRSGWK